MAGLIIGVLVGLLGIILSICVKKYKMTSLIAGFDPKKHDGEKMGKIVGDNVFLLSLLLIFFSIIRAVAVEYADIIDAAQSISTISLIVKMIYCANKYGLKEN